MARKVGHVTCLSSTRGTMQGLVAHVMAWAVTCVICFRLARGHHARGCGTHHGMSTGMRHVSWLGPWAPCKGSWHVSGHGRWHASRFLAQLMGTMQGPVGHVMVEAVENVTYLGSVHGLHERGCGTRHGTSGGTCHVSLLYLWAPCKGSWHASRHEHWHVSRVLAQFMGTMQGPVARVMA